MELPVDIQHTVVRQILIALGIIVAVFIIVRIGQRLAKRYVDDPARLYRLNKLIGRSGGILALILVIALFSIGVGDVLTVLTVFGAGMAIAMREALLSMIGWINIILRTPYRQGDRIEVKGIQGDVIDIRLFHTTLMEIGGWVGADQSTGRLVHIPNAWVYQEGVYNYTRGFNFIWNELSVTVTFRSDWQAAREIILSLAEQSAEIVEQQVKQQIKRMSGDYLVHFSILTPFVYVRITENGVRLTLRYLCEVRKRRGTEHAVTISILQAFEEHGGIELAYPMVGVSRFETPQFGPMPATHAPAHDAQNRSTSNET